MADQVGIVVKRLSGDRAEVLTDRRGGCGGCQPRSGGCRSCLSSAKTISQVSNPIAARPGDLVQIHLDSSGLLAGAAILYVLPVILMLAGALMGAGWLSPLVGWSETASALLGVLAGVVLGFGFVRWLSSRPKLTRHLIPQIRHVMVAHNVVNHPRGSDQVKPEPTTLI